MRAWAARGEGAITGSTAQLVSDCSGITRKICFLHRKWQCLMPGEKSYHFCYACLQVPRKHLDSISVNTKGVSTVMEPIKGSGQPYLSLRSLTCPALPAQPGSFPPTDLQLRASAAQCCLAKPWLSPCSLVALWWSQMQRGGPHSQLWAYGGQGAMCCSF